MGPWVVGGEAWAVPLSNQSAPPKENGNTEESAGVTRQHTQKKHEKESLSATDPYGQTSDQTGPRVSTQGGRGPLPPAAGQPYYNYSNS